MYFTTISTSSFGGDLLLSSKTCPIAAGRRSFYSVVVFYYHGSTMGCFRSYIRFVGSKLYLVHLVRPFRKSVSTLDSDVGGLYVLLFLKSQGGFLCPHVLTAWGIGVNEDRSLLVWRGISRVDDYVCLMSLP